MVTPPSGQAPVQVNVMNFVRAESDTYFDGLAVQAGGINRWHHFREPTPIEAQTVIRMNRDTLYSSIIVDLSDGAALTMPDAKGRYQTAMVVDQDHYIERVFDQPGTYHLDTGTFATPFVAIAVRTLVDPNDPSDVAAVGALQDQLRVQANSTRPFTHPAWDPESLKAIREPLLELARHLPDTIGAFGSRQATDPVKHLLGTASGWGGLPADQARYLGVEPRLPAGHYRLTVADVPVRAFWSVSVYNRHGFFEQNDLGRYSVNSVTAQAGDDGTVIINFGGNPGLPNHIPVMEGWSYVVRLYQPEPQILDGSWTFPGLETPPGTR